MPRRMAAPYPICSRSTLQTTRVRVLRQGTPGFAPLPTPEPTTDGRARVRSHCASSLAPQCAIRNRRPLKDFPRGAALAVSSLTGRPVGPWLISGVREGSGKGSVGRSIALRRAVALMNGPIDQPGRDRPSRRNVASHAHAHGSNTIGARAASAPFACQGIGVRVGMKPPAETLYRKSIRISLVLEQTR